MSHPTIFANEIGYEIDAEVLPLVRALNRVRGVTTISSCQGNPGEMGNGGFYGGVFFRKGDWRELCEFAFEVLFPLFVDMWDDVQVRVAATATGEQAWDGLINFRNEAIPEVAKRLALLA